MHFLVLRNFDDFDSAALAEDELAAASSLLTLFLCPDPVPFPTVLRPFIE
jgi:hypothetical protein